MNSFTEIEKSIIENARTKIKTHTQDSKNSNNSLGSNYNYILLLYRERLPDGGQHLH